MTLGTDWVVAVLALLVAVLWVLRLTDTAERPARPTDISSGSSQQRLASSASLAQTLSEPEGRGCQQWFQVTFGNKETVPWTHFWEQFDALVHRDDELGDERWQYFRYKLHITAPGPLILSEGREKFQSFINITPGDPSVSSREWLAAADLTKTGTLAELIKLAMTSKWSDWVIRGQNMGKFTPIIQTTTGLFIQKWRVGLSKVTMAWGSLPEDRKDILTVISLQGQDSDGKWLHEVKNRDEQGNCSHVEQTYDVPAAPCSGYTKLYGMGDAWFYNFMDGPGQTGAEWEVSAEHLGVPSGRVVGYQMRTWGPVDNMRFLFRPFGSKDADRSLVDAVFISHTGQDAGVSPLVAALHRELVSPRNQESSVPAFFDAACLPGGSKWRDVIPKWVTRSKVVVVILSPTFLTRKWPLYELSLALKDTKGRTILPVLLGVTHKDLSSTGEPTDTKKKWMAAWDKLRAEPMLAGVEPEELLASLDNHQMIRDYTNLVNTQIYPEGPPKNAIPAAADSIYQTVRKYV